MTTILSALFGSGQVDFSLESLVTGRTRSYRRFADALSEVNEARVWAGFHFRSSDVAGSILQASGAVRARPRPPAGGLTWFGGPRRRA